MLLADIFVGAILFYAFPSVARDAVETTAISPFHVALVIGILTLSILGFTPYLGPLKAIVALFGVGIISLGGYATYETVKHSRQL